MKFWKVFSQKDSAEVGKELVRLRKYMDTGSLAKRITTAIKSCNLIFCSITNVPVIFREDIKVISILHQPCDNENDFNIKLGALAELFQVDPNEWKPIIRDFKSWMKRGSTFVLKWLEEQNIAYDHEKVKIWDVIIEMRNASSPYHPTSKKLVELVNFFGQGFPMDYGKLYESILIKFLDSLEMLQRVLNDVYLQRKNVR